MNKKNGKWRAWVSNNKDRRLKQARESHLRITFGITQAMYEEMKVSQNGLCAICGKKNETKKDIKGRIVSDLFVDHCHKTNKIRGLLCRKCNLGLANFCDSKELLQKAIKYLNPEKDVL